MFVLRDIIERKDTEVEIKKAKEVEERANKVKKEFLTNMSHEIRTPLNGVIGMIDLTLLTNLNDEQINNLNTAKSCSVTLLKIIDDILDYSSMKASKFPVESVEFKIRDLVNEVIKIHNHHAANKGIELKCVVDPTIPICINGDPKRLKQILDNLISNAIKFTDEGKILISIKKVYATDKEIQLKFSIKDTGIGITAENMKKLFKSFSQIDASYTRKFGGLGLGLAIAKHLTELMGGKMWVESESGNGSIFYFTINVMMGEMMRDIKKEIVYY